MKSMLRIAMVAAVMALLAINTLAGSLTVTSPASLNGKQLEPGTYTVKLTEDGGAPQVTFYQGKTAVASAKGRLMERARTARYDSYTVRRNSDGSQAVSEVEFAGKKHILVIDNSTAMKMEK